MPMAQHGMYHQRFSGEHWHSLSIDGSVQAQRSQVCGQKNTGHPKKAEGKPDAHYVHVTTNYIVN